MEWSSRVLHHGNPEMWKFFKKFEIDKIEFCPYPEFPYAEKKKTPWLRQYQSYISNWYINGKVFTSTTAWEPNFFFFFFFQKSLKLNSTCILTCAEELKSFMKVSTCTYRSTSGMHRRPFEGRHLVACDYASSSSGEAYRDRRLTTNFEFWVEIFCVPTCFHMRIPKPWIFQNEIFAFFFFWNFFKNVRDSNFDLCWRAEITLALLISVLH